MKHGHRWLSGGLVVVGLAVALALVAPMARDSLAADGTIYVDADATTGADDGSSWDDAFVELQPALDEAVSGDEIWVAEGTYTPTAEYGGTGDRYRSFQLINGLALYGGFDPSVGATEWEDRDWETYETILSGDLAGDDGPDFTNNGENSYHVFYHPAGTDLDGSAVLDGFIVTGGNANGDVHPHWAGGGMYNYSSSPALTNCTFSGNSVGLHGGGMYNYSSSPALTNCTFSGNLAADYGGGMFNQVSSPTVTDCIFQANSAGLYGGGMFNYNSSSPALTNCTFADNEAVNSGGGMHNHTSSPALTNCSFEGNSAVNYGGGMHNYSSSPALTNCTFSGNSAADYGGGMFNEVSSPTVTDCIFQANSAGLYGGGMFNYNSSSPALTNCTFADNVTVGSGGGMHNNASSPALTNCSFEGNSAVNYGGGMHNYSSSPALTNCTFSGNSAGDYGGGMFNSESSTVLTNCTFSGNSADHGGGMFNSASSPALTNCILWGDAPEEILNNDPESFPEISYSDIEGGCDVYPGNTCGDGNIAEDPLFLDPDNGDFHLGPGSPCIDVGDNAAPNLPPYDFEGEYRILDGDGDGTAIVDMGVDEVRRQHYVDVDAAGSSDGSTWEDAFSALQPALDAAVAGDQIWVAEGPYTPTAEHGGSGDRFRSFQMVNGVAIYGGFDPDAGDTAFEDRDWQANPTILSGDLAGDDGSDFANNGENSYHVFYHPAGTDLDGTAILDGFTITGGNANGADPHFYGGGMLNDGSSPTLTNCTFAGNWASNSGGGMANYSSSSPTLTNCTFSGNATGQLGGGGMTNSSSSPALTNCTFSGNSGSAAGGILNLNSSSLALTNCIIWGNAGPEINNLDGSSSPVITYSDIQGGYLGEGNIDEDPLFVDAASGDYHLRPDSPCIDVGNNAAPDLPAYDFEGDARIVDGNGDRTATVEMGVDEVLLRAYLPLVLRGY